MTKIICVAISALLFALTFPAEAQQRAKIYRIGYLGGGLGIDEREETLRQALQELGYIEGQTIVIEWRFAKGDENRLPELAAELVRLKPDLIVTFAIAVYL